MAAKKDKATKSRKALRFIVARICNALGIGPPVDKVIAYLIDLIICLIILAILCIIGLIIIVVFLFTSADEAGENCSNKNNVALNVNMTIPKDHTPMKATDVVLVAYAAGFRNEVSPESVPVDGQGGFTDLEIAVALAKAESGWDALNVSHNGPTDGCPNGSNDIGLWQANDCYEGYNFSKGWIDYRTYGDWKDPRVSAKFAYDRKAEWKSKYSRRSVSHDGWGSWSAFKNGSYKDHLIEARAAVSSFMASDAWKNISGSGETVVSVTATTSSLVPTAPTTSPGSTTTVSIPDAPIDPCTGAPGLNGATPSGPVTDADVVKVEGTSIRVHRSIIGNVTAMIAAAKADQVNLDGGGYRSPQEQINTRIRNCGSSQYDIYEKPSSSCSPPTARPGSSQHERGLAIDFENCSSRASSCFTWLSQHAAEYGLINFPVEPWHWSTTGR